MGEYDYIIECSKLRDINKELREQINNLTYLVKDLRGCDNCDYSKEFKDTLINDLIEELALPNIFNLIHALESQLCNDQIQRTLKKFKELNALKIDKVNQKLRKEYEEKEKNAIDNLKTEMRENLIKTKYEYYKFLD